MRAVDFGKNANADALLRAIGEGHFIVSLSGTSAEVPDSSRYLIADSSKIGKRDFCTFCRLDNLDAVVCEPGITAEDRAAIEEHTQVIC